MDNRDIERKNKLARRERNRKRKNLLFIVLILAISITIYFLIKKFTLADNGINNSSSLGTDSNKSQITVGKDREENRNEEVDNKQADKKPAEDNNSNKAPEDEVVPNENSSEGDKKDNEDKPEELNEPIDILTYEEKSFDKKHEFAHLLKAEQKIKDEDELIKKLPKQIQTSIQKYPETKSELLQYHKYKDNLQSPDIKGLYKKGEIPRFIQWDSRWGFQKIGKSYISYAACGPTNLASAYIYFTGDTSMNPVVMSKWAVDNGYYSDGYGAGHNIFYEGPSKLGLTSGGFNFTRKNLKERLDNGDIVIVNVRPGDFTKGGHYIMVIGFNTKTDELTIHDVNSPKNSSKKWDFDRVKPQVKQAFYINE